MDDFKSRFAQCGTPGDVGTCEFSMVRAGLIVSLLSIGTLAGALAGAPIADALGRRWAMIVECGVFIVGVIIQLVSFSSWQQFAVGRLVSGLGVGALSAAVPMIVSLSVPALSRDRDRGASSWPSVLYGRSCSQSVCFSCPSLLVGSPRVIVSRKLVAPLPFREVSRLQNSKLMPLSFARLSKSERWLKERESYRPGGSPASSRRGRRDTGLSLVRLLPGYQSSSGTECCILRNGSSGSSTAHGANYFFYYGATVFQSVGLADSFITQIILGAVNFVCTFGGLWVPNVGIWILIGETFRLVHGRNKELYPRHPIGCSTSCWHSLPHSSPVTSTSATASFSLMYTDRHAGHGPPGLGRPKAAHPERSMLVCEATERRILRFLKGTVETLAP
ncbi:hexose transporter hxt [Salix suchowensis]|nr:hexose transporter hxt [Salix suchowensis]